MKKVGIIGLGTVGGGFYDLSRSMGIQEYEVVKVLNRSTEKYDLHKVPAHKRARSIDELVREVDVVVEAIGGVELPYEIVLHSLKKGRSVVTPNKALIATHGDELLKLAKDAGVSLLFGASVGGGMPALRYVKYHSYGKVKRVYGIVNATSNFLLSQMEKGVSFDESLKTAQRLGYAETDPSDDVSGMDAARKMAIICGVLNGILPDPENIPRQSVLIGDKKLRYAKNLRMTVKPMVYLEFEDDVLKMWNGPLAISESSRIAGVKGTENCLVIEEKNGISFLSGIGAGKNPTAFSVMVDVLSIAKGERQDFTFQKYEGKIEIPNFEEFEGLKMFIPRV